MWQALYDDVLDITWLADASLGATNNFGVNGISPFGRMSWYTANNWISGMNAANHLGFNDWRLPNATTDIGHGIAGVGWIDSNNNPASEIGHLYYSTLTDLGVCAGGSTQGCISQATIGPNAIVNDFFTNFYHWTYWTNQIAGNYQNTAIEFSFFDGKQGLSSMMRPYSVLTVRSGDVLVSSVPEPPMLLLLGTVFAGLAGVKRKRK